MYDLLNVHLNFKAMKSSNVLLYVFLFAAWVAPSITAGQQTFSLPNFEGVQKQNGILFFQDSTAFQTVYGQLETLVDAWNQDPNTGLDDDDCLDENRILDAFENQFEMLSLRKQSLINECEALERGVKPLDLPEPLVIDDVLAALMNSEGVVKVGSDLYFASGINEITQLIGGNPATLRALQQGASSTQFGGEVVVWGRGACNAQFQFSPGTNANSLSFQLVTPPQGTAVYYWTFGDNNNSQSSNPTHTYDLSGSYEVCLNIEIPEQGCSDRYCTSVTVGSSEECVAMFVYNAAGQPGLYCFTSLINTNVVSWHWDFGDGNTSSEQNPCHVYACDKWYFVKLTITTASGCTAISFPVPINVNTNSCCALFANTGGNIYYSNDNYRVKWSQGQINIPVLARRVKAVMKHYRKKSNGKWTTQKADLMITLVGNVYTKGQTKCNCQHPYPIGSTHKAFNKKKLTVLKPIGKFFRVKHLFNWSAKYYVNKQFLGEKTTPATCN